MPITTPAKSEQWIPRSGPDPRCQAGDSRAPQLRGCGAGGEGPIAGGVTAGERQHTLHGPKAGQGAGAEPSRAPGMAASCPSSGAEASRKSATARRRSADSPGRRLVRRTGRRRRKRRRMRRWAEQTRTFPVQIGRRRHSPDPRAAAAGEGGAGAGLGGAGSPPGTRRCPRPWRLSPARPCRPAPGA